VLNDYLLLFLVFTNKLHHSGMKKVLIASATLFLIALVYSSCKSHESCPAYGKADTSKNVRA
jgi:hypothetical protein